MKKVFSLCLLFAAGLQSFAQEVSIDQKINDWFQPITDATIADPIRTVTLTTVLITGFIFLFIKAGFESSKFQATPGKWILGLMVVTKSGKPIGFFRSFFRQVFKIQFHFQN